MLSGPPAARASELNAGVCAALPLLLAAPARYAVHRPFMFGDGDAGECVAWWVPLVPDSAPVLAASAIPPVAAAAAATPAASLVDTAARTAAFMAGTLFREWV